MDPIRKNDARKQYVAESSERAYFLHNSNF